MIGLAHRLISVAREIVKEKNSLDMLALVQTEDSADDWEVLFASIWAVENRGQALSYVEGKIRAVATVEERLAIAKIAIVDPRRLGFAIDAVTLKLSEFGFSTIELFGERIRRAFVVDWQAGRVFEWELRPKLPVEKLPNRTRSIMALDEGEPIPTGWIKVGEESTRRKGKMHKTGFFTPLAETPVGEDLEISTGQPIPEGWEARDNYSSSGMVRIRRLR